jgi:hypothetical protein
MDIHLQDRGFVNVMVFVAKESHVRGYKPKPNIETNLNVPTPPAMLKLANVFFQVSRSFDTYPPIAMLRLGSTPALSTA